MSDMQDRIDAWKAQREYGAEYTHRGRSWGLTFFAIDDEDAVAKLESIKATLRWGPHGLSEIVGRANVDEEGEAE